jgi:hypothetical protein
MDAIQILDLIAKGSVATVLGALAYLLWRRMESKDKEQREDRKAEATAQQAELEKQTEMLGRMVERLVRIDLRTHRLAGGRAKTPTPFYPVRPGQSLDDEGDDK